MDGIFKEASWAKLEKPERLRQLNPYETLVNLGLSAKDRMVDFGSGTGAFVRPALEIVGPEGVVYAVEQSQSLIERMLDILGSSPKELIVIQQDMMTMEWNDEPLDFALLCHVAHELPDLAGFLRRVIPFLKPTGYLAVIDWSATEQSYGPPLIKRIPLDRMREILDANGWSTVSSGMMGEDFYWVKACPRV